MRLRLGSAPSRAACGLWAAGGTQAPTPDPQQHLMAIPQKIPQENQSLASVCLAPRDTAAHGPSQKENSPGSTCMFVC